MDDPDDSASVGEEKCTHNSSSDYMGPWRASWCGWRKRPADSGEDTLLTCSALEPFNGKSSRTQISSPVFPLGEIHTQTPSPIALSIFYPLPSPALPMKRKRSLLPALSQSRLRGQRKVSSEALPTVLQAPSGAGLWDYSCHLLLMPGCHTETDVNQT